MPGAHIFTHELLEVCTTCLCGYSLPLSRYYYHPILPRSSPCLHPSLLRLLHSLGNQAFKAGDYKKAIEHYGEALKIDPSAHTYWSNRSASYAGLGDWENAANDASECLKANKNFVKGYFRLALAQKNLQRYEQALETITRGLQVDFGNNDLKSMRKEVEDGVRLQKVASYIDTAKQQFMNKEYSACLSTIDSGLRIDAGNSSLVDLQKKVQPMWEKEERTRKAGLSPVEKMKEEGDAYYKSANFEAAIQQYTKTLNKIDDKSKNKGARGRGERVLVTLCHEGQWDISSDFLVPFTKQARKSPSRYSRIAQPATSSSPTLTGSSPIAPASWKSSPMMSNPS